MIDTIASLLHTISPTILFVVQKDTAVAVRSICCPLVVQAKHNTIMPPRRRFKAELLYTFIDYTIKLQAHHMCTLWSSHQNHRHRLCITQSKNRMQNHKIYLLCIKSIQNPFHKKLLAQSKRKLPES